MIMNDVKIEQAVTGHPNQLPEDVASQMDQYGIKILSWQTASDASIALSLGASRKTTFYSLCQLVEGDGWFAGENQNIVEIDAGSFVLVCPDTFFGYGGKTKRFVEDFITFEGAMIDLLRSFGLLEPGVYPALNIRKIKEIIDCAAIPETKSQLAAAIMLQTLLLSLKKDETDASPVLRDIRNLLGKIHERPEKWWTISEMAGYCRISEVHFRRLFSKTTGSPPKKYLENIKMGLAARILSQSEITVSELASYLGYSDPYHFSRRFKKVKGVSPQHFKTRIL